MGTAAVPVGTAGYCGYCEYCRVLGTVGTALGTAGTAGVYCRVLQGVQKVRVRALTLTQGPLSAVRNTYTN